MLKTAFWKNAANSLPAAARSRHMKHLERAEHWDLALDALVEGCKALRRPFQTPRSHAH